jgi:hypothetical protein
LRGGGGNGDEVNFLLATMTIFAAPDIQQRMSRISEKIVRWHNAIQLRGAESPGRGAGLCGTRD